MEEIRVPRVYLKKWYSFAMSVNVSKKSFVCRVSSVLRRAIKEFGPRHLVDEKEDTCWNSDQVFPLTLCYFCFNT